MSPSVCRLSTWTCRAGPGLEVLRRLQRLLQAEEGVGLQHPEVRVLRVALDEHVEQRGRVLELLLLEDAAREAEAPLQVVLGCRSSALR
jgi:hypothetical protein